MVQSVPEYLKKDGSAIFFPENTPKFQVFGLLIWNLAVSWSLKHNVKCISHSPGDRYPNSEFMSTQQTKKTIKSNPKVSEGLLFISQAVFLINETFNTKSFSLVPIGEVWKVMKTQAHKIKCSLTVRQVKFKGDCVGAVWSHSPTLQGTPQQSVQLRVDLSLLLQHVEQQLVLGGAVDLRLLQPALHHLQLGVLLRRLQTLRATAVKLAVMFLSWTDKPYESSAPLCLLTVLITSNSLFCSRPLSAAETHFLTAKPLGFIKSNLI